MLVAEKNTSNKICGVETLNIGFMVSAILSVGFLRQILSANLFKMHFL
jgi:hypothetical protein